MKLIDSKIRKVKFDIKEANWKNKSQNGVPFIVTYDRRSYKINHRFDCNEKCLIYLLACNCCQERYVGQTADTFMNRWNNYKDNPRKFDRDGKRDYINVMMHKSSPLEFFF